MNEDTERDDSEASQRPALRLAKGGVLRRPNGGRLLMRPTEPGSSDG